MQIVLRELNFDNDRKSKNGLGMNKKSFDYVKTLSISTSWPTMVNIHSYLLIIYRERINKE